MQAKNSMIELIEESHRRQLGIIEKKNHDYSPGKDNYANFRSVNNLMPWVPVEEGILIRMVDKLQRAANLVHFGNSFVTEETLIDTLDDIANYANLIIAYSTEEIFNKEEVAKVLDGYTIGE